MAATKPASAEIGDALASRIAGKTITANVT